MKVRHSSGFVAFDVPDDFFETATDPMVASMVPVADSAVEPVCASCGRPTIVHASGECVEADDG